MKTIGIFLILGFGLISQAATSFDHLFCDRLGQLGSCQTKLGCQLQISGTAPTCVLRPDLDRSYIDKTVGLNYCSVPADSSLCNGHFCAVTPDQRVYRCKPM